jgi:hypothetical protein
LPAAAASSAAAVAAAAVLLFALWGQSRRILPARIRSRISSQLLDALAHSQHAQLHLTVVVAVAVMGVVVGGRVSVKQCS